MGATTTSETWGCPIMEREEDVVLGEIRTVTRTKAPTTPNRCCRNRVSLIFV